MAQLKVKKEKGMNRLSVALLSVLTTLVITLGYVRYTAPPEVRPRPISSVFKINQKAVENAKEFTVLITHEGFGAGSRGTGVLLDPTTVLTCAHLIPRSSDSEIWVYPYPGDRVVKAKVIFADRGSDLALFQLETPVHAKAYPVFTTKAGLAEPVIIIGNALGCMKWYVTAGVLTGTQGIYILTDGLVQHGNSGGPWINNNGHVIGISDWGLETSKGTDSGIYGAVGSEAIVHFLNQYKMTLLMKDLIQSLLGGR